MADFFVSNAPRPILSGGEQGSVQSASAKARFRGQVEIYVERAAGPSGVRILSFQNSKDDSRRPKSEMSADSDNPDHLPIPRKKRPRTSDLGDALRSAYQQTVSEEIPPEMLDLLGKLG